MANADRPRGFTPVRHLNGSPWNGAVEVFYHSTADATAIYKGELVIGIVGLAGAGSDPLGKFPGCIAASKAAQDTQHLLGVAWTFGNTPDVAARVDNLNAANYCPASTGMYIGVITDPSTVFSIQDSGGTALTAVQIGSYIDISTFTSATACGSTTTGRSYMEVDTSSIGASNAHMCRVLRLSPRPDNELSSWADWEVIINYHIDKQIPASTGYAST